MMKANVIAVSKDYSQYNQSAVLQKVAAQTHELNYCGQTSSANFTEIKELLDQISFPSSSSVLDAGCGKGCFSFLISKMYKSKCLGIDINNNLIREANQFKDKYKKIYSSCKFINGDFSEINNIYKFDLIICIGSLYWGINFFELLNSWKKNLNLDGYILIFLNVKDNKSLPQDLKLNLDNTNFIDQEDINFSIKENNFKIISNIENTSIYVEWLKKFNYNLKKYQEELVKELGKEKTDKIIKRFETYEYLSEFLYVKRIKLLLQKKDFY